LNEQLKLLIELQEIDTSILSIAERIEALPAKIEKFKSPFKEANLSLQKAKTLYESVGKNKRDKELEAEEFQEKINKLKAKTKDIKTNKEYEAFLKEIESFEKEKFKIEDQILSIMESLETYSGDIQKEEAKVKKTEEEFRQQEKAVEEEKTKLHGDMETYKSKRKEFVAGIDEELYEQYMNLLKRAGGLAVVSAKNEVCLGCNTNIPPQQYNDIKKGENIFTCYYCKRILYYKEL
jgi:predicted  nucleic acid-binding Zn-ribbon protein